LAGQPHSSVVLRIMLVSPAGAMTSGPAMEPGKGAMASLYRGKRFQASHWGSATSRLSRRVSNASHPIDMSICLLA
jgi:hypothetical protein